jgi:hypothetical protein
MVDLPSWLVRFLQGQEAPEEPAPGVARLWRERSSDELDDLVREQLRDDPYRRSS